MELDWEREQPRDNVVAGTVGAFLGALIGVACIVLIDRLGYVSALGGMVMAVCSIKGYTMLGGRFSKRGAVISGLMVLVLTYISNKVCFALAVMEAMADMGGIDFFTAFRSVSLLLEDADLRRTYIGALGMLYLFTLIGGLPVIINALREPADRAAAAENAPELTKEQSALQAEFYAFKKDWMKPLRLSAFIPVLLMMVLMIGCWLVPESFWPLSAGYWSRIAGFLSVIVLFFLMIPTLQLCNTFHILYVRAAGKLWQVDLKKFASVLDWEKLTPSRQEVLKHSILQEILLILEGKGSDVGEIFREMFPGFQPDSPSDDQAGRRVVLGSRRANGVILLENLRVEKEDKWKWKVSYEAESGRQKKLTIPKGYPGFAPASDGECPEGPVPVRFTPAFVAFVVMIGIIGGGAAFGEYMESHDRSPAPDYPDAQGQQEALPEAEVKAVPARVPSAATEYVMSEVCFQVDAGFEYSQRTFLDTETGTRYRAYVQYGVDSSDAWDTLSQDIGKYRTSPLYDRFDAVYLDEVPLTPRDESSQYNILSVYLTDGWVYHTAVVLSEDGTLFTMEAQHDSNLQSAEEVMGSLMFTLQSVRFEGPAVTEENYQSQIHVAEGWDCAYMATAYIKTDIFGHDAFVDVYVPYSDAPVYSSGGTAIRTEAHGLRMYVTVHPGNNAKDVVDLRFQKLAATGQIYEDGAADEVYREDMDAACRLTVYEEDGQTRCAVLYADAKWEGYYLLREITGLPELADEEYPALLAELEEILGLTVPALEELG